MRKIINICYRKMWFKNHVFKMYILTITDRMFFSLALWVAVCSSLNMKSLFAIHKCRKTFLLVDAISEMQMFLK